MSHMSQGPVPSEICHGQQWFHRVHPFIPPNSRYISTNQVAFPCWWKPWMKNRITVETLTGIPPIRYIYFRHLSFWSWKWSMFVEEWPFLTSLNLWIPSWTGTETLQNPPKARPIIIVWAIKVSLDIVLITMEVRIEVFKAHAHVLAVCFCKCRLLDIEDLSPMTQNWDFPLKYWG